MSAFFNRFPYTNLNDINLDWIIKRVKKLGEDFAGQASDISYAILTANHADATATSARNAAQIAQNDAINALERANSVQGIATNALAVAQDAADTAESAQSVAESIAGTAAQAVTIAQGASETAAGALTAAQTATETAQGAVVQAQTATALANNAAQSAQTAINTADAALTIASSAGGLNFTDIASGDIAEFPDGLALPAINVTAEINPEQDLHGYENPWPAGGGKNLINCDYVKNEGSSMNVYTPAIYVQPGVYYVYCCNESSSQFNSFVEISTNGTSFSSITTDSTLQTAYADQTMAYGRRKSKVTVVTALYLRLHPNASASLSGTIKGVVTTDATGYADFPDTCTIPNAAFQAVWAPYENICPISGYTEANITVSPTQDAQDGTVYNVTWETEAGEVYGGNLDVTNGVLTVTHGIANLANSSLNWSIEYSKTEYTVFRATNFNSVFPSYKAAEINNVYPGISSHFKAKSHSAQATASNADVGFSFWAGVEVQVSNALAATTQDWATWLASETPVIVYPLANPTTVQLTPTEIKLLFGSNCVWNDTNGATTVEYHADPQKWIEKKLNET